METCNLSIPRHVRIRIAAVAEVDLGTVERYLAGLATWPKNAERIEKVLSREGWTKGGEGKWSRPIGSPLRDSAGVVVAIAREVQS